MTIPADVPRYQVTPELRLFFSMFLHYEIPKDSVEVFVSGLKLPGRFKPIN